MARTQKFSRLHGSTILTSAMLAVALGNNAHAAPGGGNVVAGQASIASAGATTNIIQSSSRALIEWNKFDVHSGETVNFIQPGTSAIALNRVVNSLSASQINGAVNANGNVIIVNSQGVMFGAGAQVNVGGLIATTADIDNDRFMNGDLHFERAGNPNAAISNSGAIKIADGGLALLVGPNVTNDGLIQANLGTVQLASGDSFTVDLYGDGLLSLQASDALNKQLVENKGKIEANGGKVLLTAAAAKNTVHSLINMNGLIQANSVSKRGGTVVLSAAGSNQKGTQAKAGSSTVNVSGTIEARGGNGSEQGGRIEVLGDNVSIRRNSRLDASGHAGGGVILIGGDYKGEGAVQTAVNVLVEAGSTAYANALENGDGGKVIVWSDINTVFGGHIEAKGGAQGGSGGFVETSGKEYLDVFGTVDAGAVNGNAGTWLLDPRDVTITGATSNGTYAAHTFTPTGNSSTVNVSSIQSSLNGGNNVLITTGSTGGQDGDITVATDINKTAGGDATLTLRAANDIVLNTNIDIVSTSNKLNVILNADSDASTGGAVVLDDGSSIITNGGNITIGGGADPTVTAAIGNNGGGGYVFGVEIDDSTLNAGGGNISIRGRGYATSNDSNYGVFIHDEAELLTSGSGTISIVGQGGGTGASDSNYGVIIRGNLTNISAQNGAVVITGTGGGSNSSSSDFNYGVLLDNNASVSSTGSGAITITGTAGGNNNVADNNFGIRFSNVTNTIGGGGATGAINLLADTMSLSNNLGVSTTGVVTIRPITNSTSIGVAGAAGTLQVTSAILDSISAGSIVVGGNAVTGALTANAYSWNAPAALLTGSGNIAINGVQTMGNRSFLANTSSGDITIGASGGVSSTATGDAITLAASGGDFINNGGAAALSATNGRWLVYSTAPANNTLNGLTGDFLRYSCTYGGACPSFPATGNGLLYSSSPVLVLTINPDAETILYGEAAPTFTYTLSGYAGGDAATDVVSGAPVITTNYVQGNNVGSYNITTAAGTLSSSLGYSFSGTTLVNGLTVDKKGLTITANNQNQTYGDGNTFTAGFSSSGLYGSETIGSVSFATNATSSTSGNWNFGSWSITPSAATGGTFNPSNYTISYINGILDIARRALAVTAVASNKAYDGNTTATVTLSDDHITSDVLTAGYSSATFDNENVGDNKTVTVSGISVSGTDADNYSPNSSTTTLANITAASLSITANNQSQTYGDGNTFTAGFSSSGLVAGETIGSVTFATDATVSSSNHWNAGTWTITPSAATGGTFSAGNYSIVYNTGVLDIDRRNLTVSAVAADKTYDGNRTASVTLSNDAIALDVVDNTYTTARFGNKNAGVNKTVTVNGIAISGTDAGNYTLTNTTATDLADIFKRDLLISVVADDKEYDGDRIATVTLSDDRVAGDTFNTQTYNTARFDTRHVGVDKTVTVEGLDISGGDARNYNFNTSATDLADITAKALTITANNQTQTYGDGNVLTQGVTATGLVSGETLGTVDLATDADANLSGSNHWKAGDWTITASNAQNNGRFRATNYAITYTMGDLRVDRKNLIVSAVADDKVYDGNTTATVTLSDDRIASDVFDVTHGSATFDNKNVGTDKTVTITGISLSGADADNYTQNDSTLDLADITQATLSVDADDQTKVYGSADPSLTFGYSGFAAGDDESLFTGGLERLPGETVLGGPYEITLGSLSAGGNYAISYTGGMLSITPYTLAVAADELRKTYGTSDPTLTFTFGMLQNSDDISVFTGGLARTAGENVAGSPYEINIGTLGAGSNYVLDFTGASFFIDPAALFIAANNQSIRMGQNIPPLTYRIIGLALGDDASVLSGGLETVPERSLPGLYPITQGTLMANSNYTISYTPGTIRIGSPFGVNNSSEQTSEFDSSNFQGPQGINTLLSMTGGGGGLGNLSPAAGGASSGGFDPGLFGNLSPAAGGNNPQGLNNLNPSAGSSSGGSQTVGQTIALIECNEQNPCDVTQ